MLKYGQIIKLLKEGETIKFDLRYKNVIKQWKTKYPFVLERVALGIWDKERHQYMPGDKPIFELPKGTMGILTKVYIDKEYERYEVGIPNPITGTVWSSIVILKADDFTIDVNDKDKEDIGKAHVQFLSRRIHDNLKAVKVIGQAQQFDIRKKLDEQNSKLG